MLMWMSQPSSGRIYQYWAELAGLHLVPTRMPAKKRDFCGRAPQAQHRQFTGMSVSVGLWTGSWASYFIKEFSSKVALKP